jgi:hypothetical protein
MNLNSASPMLSVINDGSLGGVHNCGLVSCDVLLRGGQPVEPYGVTFQKTLILMLQSSRRKCMSVNVALS